jgi:hypothetical protein
VLRVPKHRAVATASSHDTMAVARPPGVRTDLGPVSARWRTRLHLKVTAEQTTFKENDRTQPGRAGFCDHVTPASCVLVANTSALHPPQNTNGKYVMLAERSTLRVCVRPPYDARTWTIPVGRERSI